MGLIILEHLAKIFYDPCKNPSPSYILNVPLLMSNWVSAALTEPDNPLNSDYFAFGFKTRNPKDI